MRALLLLALAAQACAVSTPTPPSAPPPLPEPHTFEEAVTFCVAEVNRNALFRFDAYAEPGNKVETFGASRQTFDFTKCMNEHGHTLSAEPTTR